MHTLGQRTRISPAHREPLDRPADAPRDRWFLVAALALGSLMGLGLVAFRCYLTGRRGYTFMPWNLLLAWLPLGFAAAAVAVRAEGVSGRLAALALGFLWLLFLPNAPYLCTDIKHLLPGGVSDDPVPSWLLPWCEGRPAPPWLDVLLVLVFAWEGLALGFTSVYLVHRAVAGRRGPALGWAVVVGSALLSGFGVALGRFERWNSWDLFSRPQALLGDVFGRVADPLDHLRTTGATLGFAAFVLVGYVTLYALMRLHRGARL